MASLSPPSHAPEATLSPPSPPSHVRLFVSSPLRSAMTPETLRGAMPEAKFWTTEKVSLTPKTAKRISNDEGRKVLAYIGAGGTSTDASVEASREARIQDMQKRQKVKDVAKAYLKSQRKRQKIQEAQHQKLMMERLMKDIADLKKDSQIQKLEQRIYAPFGLTRYLAAVQLLSTLLNFVNHHFMRFLHARDWKGWVGVGKPFLAERNISYFKGWWYYYTELHYDAGIPLAKFWAKRIGFQGEQKSGDGKNWNRIDTRESKAIAQEISNVMEQAENQVIAIVASQKEMTSEMLRSALGFFISLIRGDRNWSIHLLENLFAVQEMASQPPRLHRPSPFRSVGEEFTVNKDLRDQGEVILEDIIANSDKLDELDCIKAVVVWFADWLLLQCKQSRAHVQESWTRFSGLEFELLYCPDYGCYKDRTNVYWVYFNNKWHSWDGADWKMC